MAKLQPVRGTRDLISEDSRTHLHIVDAARATAGRYGYTPIETPVFEFTEVFKRTLGDTSDIVTKEMYTFEDKGGDSLTLRPEGTAGIARAVLSGGLQNEMPLKLCYAGPMFRRERPQKGRLRLFHQAGVQLIGGCCGSTTDVNQCDFGCDGVPLSTLGYDCHGDCNGTAAIDSCGVCAGGNTTRAPGMHLHCGGSCFDGTCCSGTQDACGVCGGDNSTCTGCDRFD